LIDDRGEMALDALWIGRIYLRRAGVPAGSDDLPGDRVEWVKCAPRQEDSSALPRENPSHSAAYVATAAVEDRGLVLKQHCPSLPSQLVPAIVDASFAACKVEHPKKEPKAFGRSGF